MLLTRSPLSFYFRPRRAFHKNHVRLACVKHAASVRPEPGSNSLLKVRLLSLTFCYTKLLFFFVLSKFLSLFTFLGSCHFCCDHNIISLLFLSVNTFFIFLCFQTSFLILLLYHFLSALTLYQPFYFQSIPFFRFFNIFCSLL